jgi:hypothetical protein
MTPSRTNILLIILGVVVLGAAAYYFLPSSDASSATALSGDMPADANEAAFIQLSSELDPISFDAHVLDDPRLTSLVDISTQVIPESSGRTDPFAPFGAGQ